MVTLATSVAGLVFVIFGYHKLNSFFMLAAWFLWIVVPVLIFEIREEKAKRIKSSSHTEAYELMYEFIQNRKQ